MALKRILIRAKHNATLDEGDQEGLVDSANQQFHGTTLCGTLVVEPRWSLLELEGEPEAVDHHLRKFLSDDRVISHEVLDEWRPSDWTMDGFRGHTASDARFERMRPKKR